MTGSRVEALEAVTFRVGASVILPLDEGFLLLSEECGYGLVIFVEPVLVDTRLWADGGFGRISDHGSELFPLL